MNFVSYQQLIADVRAFSTQLPTDLVAVAGVPRSGVLPATLLALERNIHLISLDDLRQGGQPWRNALRRGVPAKSHRRILVLDDSINSGGTLGDVRREFQQQQQDLLFGGMYDTHDLEVPFDHVYRRVPLPRCFEWNLFHSDQMRVACLDMDGVLCEDWMGVERDNEEENAAYRRHLLAAAPLHIPTYPVLAIVTSRLEKYRPETIAWLRKHDVKFRELLMSPHASAAERRRAGDHARHKASWYTHRPESRLFVESDPRQAAEIARLSSRPVLCTESMLLHNSRNAFIAGEGCENQFTAH